MVKIDTKEAFCIIMPSEEEMTENMSVALKNSLLEKKKEKPGSVILKIPRNIPEFSGSFLQSLKEIQTLYLKDSRSFFLSPVSATKAKKQLEQKEINFTPTIAEAIDMLMMENLERELLGPSDSEIN